MADSTATAKNPKTDNASYKDTVESILVAFILAFIFRAFVVEAFVIPTGSMAPTLYGAHMRLTCPDCGYTFDVGFRGAKSENGDDIDIPGETDRPSNIRCPNCAYDFPTQDALGKNISQPLRFGDRILVLKYLYLFDKPHRWDVVVFKSPSEEPPHHVAEDPEYSQNFIKRLIGTPTESIVILDGDIYVGPTKAKGVEKLPDDSYKVLDDADQFQIQRKPLWVQERLWRLVYDNDFVPQGHATSRSTTWHEPWQPVADGGSGWNQKSHDNFSRVFDFNNPGGTSTLFFNANANRDLYSLTDWIAYDQLDSQPRDRPWVSDLKLSCFYTRKSGDGRMRIMLTKLDHCFVAEFAPGKVSLYESKMVSPSDDSKSTGEGFDPGKMSLVTSVSIPELAGSAPAQIDFMNYDYRITLQVNGKTAIEHDYAPNVKQLWQEALASRNPTVRPEVRISAEKQVCSIEHLGLWHDVYYGNRGEVKDSEGNISDGFWGGPKKVMHLNEGEYFVLGDNSLISGDARYWGDPILLPHEGMPFVQSGRVPESFMLGKAFFVYWPAGYRLPLISKNIIPDFGEMRFIH